MCHGRVQECMTIKQWNQCENKTYHFEDMHSQCLTVCMWVMDTEETRQRQAESIRDEMLQANYAHQMATDYNEWEDRRKVKCQRNVLQIVMERNMNLFGHVCRLNNSRLTKQVVFDKDWNPRKRQQRMAQRYQGVVSDGRAFNKHLGMNQIVVKCVSTLTEI